MKITRKNLKKIIIESARAGELMLLWNGLQVGDLVDVDGEYNYYPRMRITRKVEDVSQISGMPAGPGFIGVDEDGDDIVFNVEDVSAESYQKYVFTENKSRLKRIIREVAGIPGWPEKHFAWRNVVFTRDGDVRYINDVASPETLGAMAEMGEDLPPGANVLVIMGSGTGIGSKRIWMHDAELLDLIDREGWYERPPPKGADPGGFWDGKGEWLEPASDFDDLPPELSDLPPAEAFLEARIISEMAEFAATAEEEANKINSETGISLVTDQTFWEERGISTGEELAKHMLTSTYWDYYKELHGFRPRWMDFSKMSIEDVQAELDALDAEAAEMAAEDEHWKKIEKEQEDWDAVMTAAIRANPEDIPKEYLEYEAPTQQGMGRRPAGSKAQRRMESTMKTTKTQLRRIIREAARDWYGEDPHRAEGVHAGEPEAEAEDRAQYDRGYQDGLDGFPIADDANPDYDAGYEDGALDAQLGDQGPPPTPEEEAEEEARYAAGRPWEHN